MAQVQDVWNKLNSRERLTAIGALLVVVAWLVGAAARGFGVGSLGLIGAIAVLAILYLKYAPNSSISWPVAVPIITLAISGIIALFAVLTLVDYLGFLDVLGAPALLGLALYVIGALVMAWGSYQEYQVEKPALPILTASPTTTTTAQPAAPATEQPASAAPATEPPASASAPADSEENPPA